MHRILFSFALILFLAACSVPPLPQATAVTPTDPLPSTTATPQSTSTPEPTLIPTPIPEPFIIQDGELMKWDSSQGIYQSVVLSDSALPEGAEIIENEILSSDGAILYQYDAATGEWKAPKPAVVTLTPEQIIAMSDEQRLAAAPGSWAEKGLTRGSRVFDNLVSYVDSAGVIRGWFDLELGEFRTGFLDEYVQNGLQIRVLFVNDPSLAENGEKDYYVIPGEESKLSKVILQILAINWAYQTKRIENWNIEQTSISQQIPLIDQLVPQFANGWLDGSTQADLPTGVIFGGIRVTQFGEAIDMRIVATHGEKTSPRTGDGGLPWAQYEVDGYGNPVMINAASLHVASRGRGYGGRILTALRDAVIPDIMDIDVGGRDISGTLVVVACGMDPVIDPAAIGLTNPNLIRAGDLKRLQRLPLGSDEATKYNICVVTNK